MKVTIRQPIKRPAAEVFEYLADASNNPKWQKGMVACTWEGDGPIAVGSRYRQEAQMMGKPIVSLFEVTALEPGRSVSIATIESTFPIQVTRSVEETPDGCVAQADVSGEPGGCFALLGPLMGPMLRSAVTKDYKRLASLLESEG
ncbi:MAG: hypothetical protein GY898_28170 [Proteobacteria bacterium]|nr:hypothetical protein [Pseudomonadota bacterium]